MAKAKLVKEGADPFPHFVVADFYEAEFARTLSDWLGRSAPWRRSVHHFYDQFELDFRDVSTLPPTIATELLAPEALSRARELAAATFRSEFRPEMCVGAHRLTKGQGIGIHTDSAPGGESHRIIVQLSRGWRDEFGGHLVFLNSPEADDVHEIFRHVFNTGIGFALGGRSYHAVSNVLQGERLTVIYSLWSSSSEFDAAHGAGRTFSAG